MKKGTIFIHAGLHKTGTTSIQYFLDRNKEILKNKNIDYIDIGKHGYGHHLIPWAIKNSPRLQPYHSGDILDQFHDYLNANKSKNILISSEEFEFFIEPDIKILKEIIKEYHVKIIVYLKRQDKLLLSEYKQIIKQFRTRFRGSLLEFVFEYKFWSRLDYFERLTRWDKIFGKDAVIIKLFEPEKFYKKNVIFDFMPIFDITVDEIEKCNFSNDYFQNQSPSDLACDTIRHYNNIILNNIQHKRVIKQSQLISSQIDRDNQYYIISCEERKKICMSYNLTNEKIMKRYFNQIESPSLFSDYYGETADSKNKDKLISNMICKINKKLNLMDMV